EKLLGLLELDGGVPLLGHVPEREQNGVIFVEHAAEAHARHQPLAEPRLELEVHTAWGHAVREATQEPLGELAIVVADELDETRIHELRLGVSGNFTGARIGEKYAPRAIDDHHAVR